MKRTGRGRPMVALALSALALLAIAPAAPAASRYGNVVEVAFARPAADEVVLTRLQATMALRPGRRGGLGSLRVRRAGGGLPRGFAVAAVRARPRGATVTVWLAAVRTRPARAGRPLRVRLRIGGARVAYRRATTWSVAVRPATTVRRAPGCGTISGEAERWTAVGGLRSIALGGRRFAARTAAGAAVEAACRRSIRSLSPHAAERFLNAVDRRFAGSGAEAVEGFFATWARDAAGNATACVYVRGAPGGGGDVTIAGTTQRFALDPERGVARVDAGLPGPGDHPFLVRWRQRDGTVRESESVLRIPADGTRGDDPPPPYAAAGPCA